MCWQSCRISPFGSSLSGLCLAGTCSPDRPLLHDIEPGSVINISRLLCLLLAAPVLLQFALCGLISSAQQDVHYSANHAQTETCRMCMRGTFHALPADSDIDLGLFGVMHGVSLEAITSGQAKKLLYSILSGLHRAHLVHGKVCHAMEAIASGGKLLCHAVL